MVPQPNKVSEAEISTFSKWHELEFYKHLCLSSCLCVCPHDNDLLCPPMYNMCIAMLKLYKYGCFSMIRLQQEECYCTAVSTIVDVMWMMKSLWVRQTSNDSEEKIQASLYDDDGEIVLKTFIYFLQTTFARTPGVNSRNY